MARLALVLPAIGGYKWVDGTAVERIRMVPTVIIYSQTTCSWCAKAKAFFRERGITPYVIESDMADPGLKRKIAAEIRAHGSHGFPFVKIDGHAVPGYSPEKYERLLSS
jgi:glutaredoxin